MPDLSANITALRANRHNLRGYLSVFKGNIVAECEVVSIQDNFPFLSLEVTYTTGAFTDVNEDNEVMVYSSTGQYKGRLRVSIGIAIQATILPINEVGGNAQIFLEVGDVLHIYDDIRPRPRLPYASFDLPPDQKPYATVNSSLPPVAICGGAYATFVDVGETYATIDFDASDSYTLDPDSAGTLSYAWTFPTGSTPASSAVASPTGVQVPAGEHRIKLVVTDTSNSQTATRWLPVWVHDANNQPLDCFVDSLSGDLELGWQGQFSLLDSLGQDDLPDGSLVAFWVLETINSTTQSFGNILPYQSRMKFVGWLRSDATETTAENSTLQVTAVGILGILNEMVGFSKALEEAGTPDSWQEMTDVSVTTMIVQILRWYTTTLKICDIRFDITDYAYAPFYIQKQVPLAQIKEAADAIDGRVTADRTGCILVHTRPELIFMGQRNAVTTTLTLSDDDIIALRLNRVHYRPVELVQCNAVKNDGSKGLLARFPGVTPNEGSQSIVFDRLIAPSQFNLNNRAGYRGAAIDGVLLHVSTGEFDFAPTGEITLFGSYDVFDFYKEYIEFTLDATSNYRQTDVSKYRWYVRTITIEYLDGTATVTLQLQAETGAPAGTTYIEPEIPSAQIPPYDLGQLPSYYPDPNATLSITNTTDNVACITNDGDLLVTTDFTVASPTWVTTALGGSLASSVVLDARVDPLSPLYLGSGSAVNIYVLSIAGIDYVSDIFGTPVVANRHLFSFGSANAGGGGLDVAYANEAGQYIQAIVRDGTPIDLYSVQSTDAGQNFTETLVEGSATNVSNQRLAVSIDPKTTGTAIAIGVKSATNEFLKRTGNYGGAWSTIASDLPDTSYRLTSPLYLPFVQNTTRYAFVGVDVGGTTKYLYRYDLTTSETLDITYYDGATPYGVYRNFGVSMASGNPNRLLMCGNNATTWVVAYSDAAFDANGFMNWQVIASGATRYYAGALVDPDGTGAYLWGDGVIAFWDGATVASKNGTGFTTDDVISIFGG